MTSITSSPDSIVVGGTKDPHKFDELSAISATINNSVRRILGIQNEINAAINGLDGAGYVNARILLRKRFIDCKGWRRIAYEMSYSDKQCKRIYAKGIDAITPIVEARLQTEKVRETKDVP